MKPYLLPLAAALALPCAAEDLTLTDGTVLRDAGIVRQDDESATISHAAGVQRVLYHRLPPELQQRLNLTPEAVQARKDEARQAERRRAEAREKKAAQQREALRASGLTPRYMTGADVISLYSAWHTLSAAAAEYLAAEWNRREALRCGLTVEAQRFKEDAAVLSQNMEKERAELQKALEREATLTRQLQALQRELDLALAEQKKLERQNQELRDRPPRETTVVVPETRVETRLVPVYQPPPVIIPPVRVTPPPPAKPPVVRPATPPVRQQTAPGGTRIVR